MSSETRGTGTWWLSIPNHPRRDVEVAFLPLKGLYCATMVVSGIEAVAGQPETAIRQLVDVCGMTIERVTSPDGATIGYQDFLFATHAIEKPQKVKPPTLKQIAERIDAHLKRMENDPKINRPYEDNKMKPYYRANAHQAGAYVVVVYISFQGSRALPRIVAERYLAHLDGGGVGKHHRFTEQGSAEARVAVREAARKEPVAITPALAGSLLVEDKRTGKVYDVARPEGREALRALVVAGPIPGSLEMRSDEAASGPRWSVWSP